MRPVLLAALALAALPAETLAQAYYMPNDTGLPPRGQPRAVQAAPVQHQPGSLGGGLIEFIMTGRDPSPYARPQAMPAPQPARSAVRSAAPAVAPEVITPGSMTPGIDPLSHQPVLPARRQMAAIAPRAEFDRPIERAVHPRFARQEIDYRGPHGAGTIVIDTEEKFLYLVQSGGRAIRYGIGVGRPGFEWAGVKSVTRKAEWPDWRPPAAMLKRRPDLPRFMPGGEDNPLGARALYLGSSLYRIHGTNEPHTIGQAVSSGCIRMTNADVIDLYDRVRVGARVIVR